MNLFAFPIILNGFGNYLVPLESGSSIGSPGTTLFQPTCCYPLEGLIHSLFVCCVVLVTSPLNTFFRSCIVAADIWNLYPFNPADLWPDATFFQWLKNCATSHTPSSLNIPSEQFFFSLLGVFG